MLELRQEQSSPSLTNDAEDLPYFHGDSIADSALYSSRPRPNNFTATSIMQPY